MDRHRVVVVGGGLAGLFTATALMGEGVDDVVVVEKEVEPGGVARTLRRQGFVLEPAAGTMLLPHPHLSPLLESIGAPVVAASPSAGLRYVYTGGRLVALEPSPKALLAPIVPLGAKARAIAETLIHTRAQHNDETLEQFCQRRFGEQAGSMLAWLMASGVFAGDPRRLSAQACFPLLVEMEAEAGSVIRGALRRRKACPEDAPRPRLHLPADGIDGIARAAALRLDHRFRGGRQVASVTYDGSSWIVDGDDGLRAETVVLACSPHVSARLVGGDLGEVLDQARAAPVAVVALGGRDGGAPFPPGFGALVGPGTEMVTRGVLFESSYAPSRAPEGSWLIKAIVGGAGRPEAAEWTTGRLIDRVLTETGAILGEEIVPSFVEVIRHRPGIPQYEVGHRRWLAALDAALTERPGLHLTGWGYRGVGLAQLAADAAALARRIAGDLTG